jgi:phosphotransferase system enzyme I (PtsP)
MQRGEGLVGLIAETSDAVNLSEAQQHPAFSYRPETGEEIYHSFLGVPVVRSGETVGVLVVQNRTPRHYTGDEQEALQTTAMVLAEYIASGAVAGLFAPAAFSRKRQPLTFKGQTLADAIALGHVVLHEPRVVVTTLVADDVAHERKRLAQAIRLLRAKIDAMLERRDMADPGEHRDVLEAYRMFARDKGWIGRIKEAIATGLTAEAAVERVRNDTRARMLRKADSFWRERFRDLEDLYDRLLRLLAGREDTAAAEMLPEDTILVARTMGPAELLDYDRGRLRGLVIEEGGTASHVAIVAKALGIAAIGQAKGIVDAVEAGDSIILDGDTGEVRLRPSPEVISAYSDKVRFRARRQQRYSGLRNREAITRDGERVSLNINAGLKVDMPNLALSGADGIGLFRTELEFMISSTFPLKDRQAAIYQQVLDAADGRPVVFRSLDIGGDKLLPYFRHETEENPAMGWRAMRMTLDRASLFRTQVRALLKAAKGRELRIMLPMVSTVAEYRRARALVAEEQKWVARMGWKGASALHLGAMIEVPALLFELDALFSVIDFASVGSNDLVQFLFAADRNNDRLAGRYDPLSPQILRALARIVEAARRHRKPLTLCGELAGRPIEAMTLIGLGFRSISMAPASIGPVKAMILSLDAARFSAHLAELLTSDADSLRDAIRSYAVGNGVEIDLPVSDPAHPTIAG